MLSRRVALAEGLRRLHGKAHVKGRTNVPLLKDTIGGYFDRQTAATPNSEALIVDHQNVRWTYQTLQEKVDAFTAGLVDIGMQKGDRLGVWLPNVSEYVVATLAAAKAGVILVTVNPAYRVPELEHALNLVGMRALVVQPSFRTSDYVAMLNQLHIGTSKTRVRTLKHVIGIGKDKVGVPGALRFEDLYKSGSSKVTWDIDPHDAINIQFTSGTTGRPKGATLTHHNILNNGFFVGETMKLTQKDRVCIPVPLYHCFGLVIGNLAAITHGSSMVYPSEGFDPAAVLRAVQKERCTALMGVPTMFLSEMAQPDFAKFDLSSLRTGVMAGSSCPIEVMRNVIGKMNLRDITICYGMTETSPVSFQTSPDDPLERRVDSVGRIHPHVQCKIVDDEGFTVPHGTPGQLLTSGYCVMQGYWGDDKKTKEALRGGWMHTGDVATIDADGYCRIVGRKGDMIIRGGENIYPLEVEEVLFKHGRIQNCAVIGVPDPFYGEQVCCWITLRAGDPAIPKKGHALKRGGDGSLYDHPEIATLEADIRAYLKDRLSHFKVPRYFLFRDDFPLTVTGKVQKFEMRKTTVSLLGLE